MSGLPNCLARIFPHLHIAPDFTRQWISTPTIALCKCQYSGPKTHSCNKCQSRPHAKMVLLEVCPILQRVSSSICTVCTGAGKLTKSALAIERRERETKLYFLVFIARVRSHGGGREGKEAKKGLSWSENSEAKRYSKHFYSEVQLQMQGERHIVECKNLPYTLWSMSFRAVSH